MEQPMQAPQAAPVPPEQTSRPPEQPPEQTSRPPEQGGAKEVHQRFIVNVMKLASESQHEQMMAMAKSADNGAQALGRALYFIVSAVKTGLEGKGVEIPPEAWLAENGILEQSARLISALLLKGGVKLEKEDIAAGIELTAEQIVGDADKQQSAVEEAPPEQMPIPQEQGLLSGGAQ